MKTMGIYTEPAPLPQNLDRPKSYLSEEEKSELLEEGGWDLVYAGEASAAREAKDMDACWAWMARTELPAHSLVGLKNRWGAEFIRALQFNDRLAKEKYGADWLEKDYDLCGRVIA